MSTVSMFGLLISTSIIASLVSATKREQETSDFNQLHQETQTSVDTNENEMKNLKDILANFGGIGDERSLMEDVVEVEIDVDGIVAAYDDTDGMEVRRLVGKDYEVMAYVKQGTDGWPFQPTRVVFHREKTAKDIGVYDGMKLKKTITKSDTSTFELNNEGHEKRSDCSKYAAKFKHRPQQDDMKHDSWDVKLRDVKLSGMSMGKKDIYLRLWARKRKDTLQEVKAELEAFGYRSF